MVLLPDPDKYKKFKDASQNVDPNRTTFFEHPELDKMAKYFIGNNQR